MWKLFHFDNYYRKLIVIPKRRFLTIKYFISLNITNTGHLTFNKTCCEKNGVPEGCMIQCTRDTSLRSLAPPRACEKWENIISECIANGRLYLLNEYILIIRTRCIFFLFWNCIY